MVMIIREMNLLDSIAKRIRSQPNLSWVEIASKIGIDVNDIDKIKKKENSVIEFVSTVTNKIWQEIFKYLNITSGCENYVKITNIDKLIQILSGNIKSADVAEKPKVDVVNEIAKLVAEWEVFARILGFKDSYINDVQRNYPSPDLYIQRNLELMKHLSHPLPPNTSWEFWRQYLNQFENGRIVISEIEEKFPDLLSKIDSGAHNCNKDQFRYFGHPFQYKHCDAFGTKNDRTEIPVRLGYNDFVDYQSISQWIDTQQQYSDRYTVLKEINSFNYLNIGNYDCPVLATLKNYLDNTNDTGFVVKGYHFVNHICLFKPGLFAKDLYDDHYFCFLVNDGIVLYITECSQGKGHALHHSTCNIQIANLLHKELNSNEIVQVKVIVHKDYKDVEFCNSCIDNELYVAEEIFENYEKFLLWYSSILHHVIKLKLKSKESTAFLTVSDICQSIKKDMFTYEALENTSLPSFSYCAEDQVEELEKMIVLTPPQVKALYSNENHIVLRGPYGSGKSVVLEKRFEKVVASANWEDVSYLMCHDQQSEFYHHMKILQAKYPERNIIVCQSKDIVPSVVIPRLSTILTNIKNLWSNNEVHLFIDEFSGSYFDENEIVRLKEVLKSFDNSHIVIALQSLEENVTIKNTQKSDDFGYQFNYLCEKTSFVICNLQHSLRCSYEINEFVKATARIVESSQIKYSNVRNFHSEGKFIDKEFGVEMFNSMIRNDTSKDRVTSHYKYNHSDITSHSVKSGPVNIYFSNKNRLSQKLDISIIYISVLSCILNDASRDKKYVVCTYDKDLYNSTAYFLKKNLFSWTNDINEFTSSNSQFEVLLTDYASIRGFEFPNFVFMVPLGSKFLIYRFVECLSRATSNLFIITDNRKIAKKFGLKNSEYEISKKIVKKWRTLDSSIFYNVNYDKAADIVTTDKDGEIVVLKEHVSCIDLGFLEKFPWVDGVPYENSDNEIDGVLAVIRNLLPADNFRLCQKVFEVKQDRF